MMFFIYLSKHFPLINLKINDHRCTANEAIHVPTIERDS